ncbi:hypothetical protein ACH24_04505 [Francisella persica ATCC VR-331]|uniref:Uncharacterized protein n=1 Tax=Francisella persica ATCC VR-331 TaxID=1086726 RepID=A0AAC8ZMU1_9GAMM|nr:hypothetical protein ACH24_04505 [Francisella persica ATCC VR-331]ANH77160.1 hypothetical protein FSC845_00620 [Francisella persica ATCC VR-331]
MRIEYKLTNKSTSTHANDHVIILINITLFIPTRPTRYPAGRIAKAYDHINAESNISISIELIVKCYCNLSIRDIQIKRSR